MSADDHVATTRAFFGPRAAEWDERFPHDGPSYASAGSPGRVRVRSASARHRLWLRSGPRRPARGSRRLGHCRRARPYTRDARCGATRGEPIGCGPLARRRVRAAVRLGLARCRLRGRAAAPPARSRERADRLARVVGPGGRLVLFHPIGRARWPTGTVESCVTTSSSIRACCPGSCVTQDGAASESSTIRTVTWRSHCARASRSTRSALDRPVGVAQRMPGAASALDGDLGADRHRDLGGVTPPMSSPAGREVEQRIVVDAERREVLDATWLGFP